MKRTNTYLFSYARYTCLLVLACLLVGCNLFDKELKQDKAIATYKDQIAKNDSTTISPQEQIKTLENIINQIDRDEDLVSLRKKNLLLAQTYCKLGNRYKEASNYTQAISSFDKVIAISPTGCNAYQERGLAYEAQGFDDKAMTDYNQAIGLNKKNSKALLNRAALYTKQTKYDQALADYSTVIALQPKEVEAYNGRGMVYYNLKAYTDALTDYNTALALDSLCMQTYIYKGEAYSKLKNYSLASAAYQGAIDAAKKLEVEAQNPNNNIALQLIAKRELAKLAKP